MIMHHATWEQQQQQQLQCKLKQAAMAMSLVWDRAGHYELL